MPRDTNIPFRNHPLDGVPGFKQPHSRVSAGRPEDVRQFQPEYDDPRVEQRKRPDKVVVLDD